MIEKDRRVVIIGAGFAGLYAAKMLGRQGIPVVIIDRRNYHLFQPLLYQVATASLSPAEIAEPIRKILRRYRSVDVVLDDVVGIEQGAKAVILASGRRVLYSYLVVATGATHSYFGRDHWAATAPGLKTIEDATAIRAKILAAFEHAEAAESEAEQGRHLTFAVVGGGPTGVEMAGAIAEIARRTLVKDFRRIDPAGARVLLIEGGARLLAGFDAALSEDARRRLERLGVEVVLSRMVEDISTDALTVAGERLPVGTVIWAAGVTASPVGQMLDAERDRSGRVIVDQHLSLPGDASVFVAGDLAHAADEKGDPLPGLAQVAKQQGQYLGRALSQRFRRLEPIPAFRYRSRGNVAIIGRHAAIFEGPRVRLRGTLAWLLWAAVHIYLLVGFHNRVLVCVQWLWRYLTDDRGARLIIEGLPPPREQPRAPDPDPRGGAGLDRGSDGPADSPPTEPTPHP